MKIIKNQLEKSHTCEEGGAHLRISFGIYWWTLKNLNFDKMKKIAEGIIILHV